jgi:hypothetical protein
MPASIAVYLELGTKKVFAAALDWPGWCRSARDEAGALAALAAYRARYLPVVTRAGARLPPAAAAFTVVERLPGSTGTDVGAPMAIPDADRIPATAAAARRGRAVLEAAWAVLDEVAGTAPASLRKGPRGGGRDRDAVVAHVVEAERAYARKIGLRVAPFDPADATRLGAFRAGVLEQLAGQAAAERSGGGPVTDWPVAYAVRRMAWHVLDHAWEIEDRS